MAQTAVRFDRAYRGRAEITNPEKLHARILGVPHGGSFNAEDVVELEYATKKKMGARKKKVTDPATGAETEVDVLDEIDTGEREDVPSVARVLSRRYERRTAAMVQGDAKPLVDALNKKGWPFVQLEGGTIIVAHPRTTRIGELAAAVQVKLTAEALELSEPE